MVTVALLPPAAAVMTVVPAFTAVTTPLLLTVATVSSLLLHCTSFDVAFSGRTVAVRVPVSPSVRVRVSGLTVTLSTWTTLSPGVTVTVAVTWNPASLASAVIVVSPSERPVTTPFFTVAMPVSALVQSMRTLPLSNSGSKLTLSSAVSPALTVRVLVSISMFRMATSVMPVSTS